MSDYLTNLIGQQRPKNTVPVPTQTQGPYVPPFPTKPKFKLLPDSPQDALRELGENFGVVGRGLTQGVAAPVTMIADPLTDFINQVLPKGYKQTRPGEAIGQGLDVAGVPRATTDAQKVLEAGTSGLAGGGAIAKTAQLAGKGAQALKGYLDTIGKDLAGQMTSGLGSGAGSVGATQAATASGASPVVAQLAGLGGGIVGGGARPAGARPAGVTTVSSNSELSNLKDYLLSNGMKIVDEKPAWYGNVGVSHYFNVETPSGNIIPVRASDHSVGQRRLGEAENYLFGHSDPESFTKSLLESENKMLNTSNQRKLMSENQRDNFVNVLKNQIENAPNSKTKKDLFFKLNKYLSDYEKSH